MIGSTAHMQQKNNADDNLLTLISDIPSLFNTSFSKQAKAIAEAAEKTENYVDHKAYKSVDQELKANQRIILNHFNKQFSKALTHSESGPSLHIEQALNFHTDHLSLVTDSELTYQIQLESRFSDSENNFEHCLISSGWKSLAPQDSDKTSGAIDCIRPGFLALLVQNSLDDILEDKQVARITYRFVGAFFFDLLTHFYDEIIPALETITEEKRQHQKQLRTEQESQERDVANEQSDSKEHASFNNIPTASVDEITSHEELRNTAGTNVDVSGLIKNWDVPANLANSSSQFSGFSDIDFNEISPDTQIQTASTEDISKLLSKLSEQARIGSESEAVDIRSVLKDSLKDLTDEGILTVIDKVSENILNLVSHLFEDLGGNDDLIDSVVCQISRIQASVMQVALTDSKMFQSSDHPVRQYINNLGKLGVRISDNTEEGYYELRDSVSQLLQDFTGNIDTFAEQSQLLQQYIDESIYSIKWSDGSYDNDEYKDAVKNTSIQDFLESQQSLLTRELNFHKLLRMVWGAILAKVLVRKGSDSEEWNIATEIYSSTLWSTQVDADDTGKREILRRLPKIIQGTRNLFDHYGLNTDIRDALQEQMIQMHLQIIRGVDGKDIEESCNDSLDLFLCLKGRILEETKSEHNAEFDAVEIETASEEALDPTTGLFSRFDSISPFDLENPEEDVDWDSVNASDDTLKSDLQSDNSINDKQDLDIVFKQINRLPLDTIFEFNLSDNDASNAQTRRYRLNNKSIVLGKYTFKCVESEEVLERDKAALALEILRGSAKRIEEGNIFDSALESVVAQMQI